MNTFINAVQFLRNVIVNFQNYSFLKENGYSFTDMITSEFHVFNNKI